MLYHQSGYAPEWMAQREENMIARRSVSAVATVLIVLLLASCMTADKVDELVSAQVSQMQANIIMLVEQTARSMVKQEVETTVAEVLKRMQAIEAQYSTIVAANATLKEEVRGDFSRSDGPRTHLGRLRQDPGRVHRNCQRQCRFIRGQVT